MCLSLVFSLRSKITYVFDLWKGIFFVQLQYASINYIVIAFHNERKLVNSELFYFRFLKLLKEVDLG